MRTSALFGTKNFGFFEIYVVSVWTRKKGELIEYGHFTHNGGMGQFFSIFADVFYGWPLFE